MSKTFQSPVNLAFRLESLAKSLAQLESHPQMESENVARRLVALLRASSEFRGMESLLHSSQIAEKASSETFVEKLRELIAEIQKVIDQTPAITGMVLVVSSDKAYVTRLVEKLQAMTHQVIVADSPRKANDLLAVSPVAFCIVDIVLADMDGRAFIADLRTRPATAALPVIAITPGASGSTPHQPFSVPGADGLLLKMPPLRMWSIIWRFAPSGAT